MTLVDTAKRQDNDTLTQQSANRGSGKHQATGRITPRDVTVSHSTIIIDGNETRALQLLGSP